MAFLKFAEAIKVSSAVDYVYWHKTKESALGRRIKVASEMIKNYSPEDYMLSHCFVPGTLVLAGDGSYKKIEDIKIGDLVITHTGKRKRVIKVLSRYYEGDLVEVKVEGRYKTLKCTPEHPFRATKNGEFCLCGCGQETSLGRSFIMGHQTKLYKGSSGGYSTAVKEKVDSEVYGLDWVAAEKLNKWKWVALGMPSEVIWHDDATVNRARLIGYFAAEGYFEKQRNRECKNYGEKLGALFAFSNEEDKYVEEVVNLLRIEFPKAKVFVEDRTPVGHNVKIVWGVGEDVAQWFYEKCGEYSIGKKLSSDILFWPTDIQKHVLWTWYRGDKGASISKVLEEQMYLIALRCGYAPTLFRRKDFEKYAVAREVKIINDREYILYTHERGDHFYMGYQLNFRRSDITKDFKEFGVDRVNVTGYERRHKIGQEPVAKIRWVKRENDYKGLVYNLSVEEDESYVVNGVVVHNCTIISSVDVEKAPKGRGKYDDYYIVPETECCVNNNWDAWERRLLLATYPTFKGADNYCFGPGTRVTMSDGGSKNIEDIEVGEYVLTHRGRSRKVIRKFKRFVCEDVIKLRVWGHPDEIVVTRDHKFYVLGKSKCICGCGKRVYRRRALRFSGHKGRKISDEEALVIEEKCAEDLTLSDRLVASIPMKVVKSSENITSGKARLIGYFLAKGFYWYYKDERAGIVFSFGCEGQELEFVNEVVKLLKQEFPDWTKPERQNKGVRISDGLQSKEIHCNNKKLAQWFYRYCGEYAGLKQLPEEAIYWPLDLQKEILCGYFRGDGSPKEDRNWVVSVSEKLIDQMQFILRRFGIWCGRMKVVPEKKKVVCRKETELGEMVWYEAQGKDKWNGQWIKSQAQHILLTRGLANKKLNEFLDLGIEVIKPQKSYVNRLFGNKILSKVRSIKHEAYAGYVYNIEVEEDHSYLLRSIEVRNCEHIQVKSLSKGKVIDAVAREVILGERTVVAADGKRKREKVSSIYIDILVATDRKNKELVKDIEEDRVNTLSMGCFIPGTEITLSNGVKIPIEEIRPGDLVITHKGRPGRVLNVQRRWYEGNVYEIKSIGNYQSVTATSEHPFYVPDIKEKCQCGCDIELPQSNPNTFDRTLNRRFLRGHDKNIFNPHKIYSLEELRKNREKLKLIKKSRFTWKRADQLKEGDAVTYPASSNMSENPNNISVGLARLFGYFLAEGSYMKGVVYEGPLEDTEDTIYCRVCGRHFQSVATHLKGHSISPEEYKKRFPEAPLVCKKFGKWNVQVNYNHLDKKIVKVGIEFSLGEHEYETVFKEILSLLKQEFSGKGRINTYGRNCIRLEGSEEVASLFYEYCGEYCYYKKLKEEVLYWPVELQKHLLATWLIGDDGATTSKVLADQLYFIFSRCKISVCKLHQEGQETSKLVKVNKVVNGENIVIMDRVQNYCLQWCNRLMKELRDQLNYAFKWKYFKKLGRKSEYRVIDDSILRKIKGIKTYRYSGYVYNLEVERDNSYIANDFCVHNCSVKFTICSKCGNVAEDETELCEHIKYQKGNHFYDGRGIKRIIAELCGHHTDPDSNNFIEASWVRNPAFEGAVKRNILKPTPEVAAMLRKAFEEDIRVNEDEKLKKAASKRYAQEEEEEKPEEEKPEEEEEKPPEKPPEEEPPPEEKPPEIPETSLKKVKEEVKEQLRKDIAETLKKELTEELAEEIKVKIEEEKPPPEEEEEKYFEPQSLQETFVRGGNKEFLRFAKKFKKLTGAKRLRRIYDGLVTLKKVGWEGMAKEGFSRGELLGLAYFLEKVAVEKPPYPLKRQGYKVIVKVGGVKPYKGPLEYIKACRKAWGRPLSNSEKAALIVKGKIYSCGRES